MLRDPVKNFESGFGFFRDYPWPQWLGEKNRKVEDFLDNAEKLYDKKTPWHFRAKNYMGEFILKYKIFNLRTCSRNLLNLSFSI